MRLQLTPLVTQVRIFYQKNLNKKLCTLKLDFTIMKNFLSTNFENPRNFYKSGHSTNYRSFQRLIKSMSFVSNLKSRCVVFFLKNVNIPFKVTGLDSQGSSIETRSRSTLDTSRAKTSRNRFSAHNNNYNNNFNRFSGIFSSRELSYLKTLCYQMSGGRHGGHMSQLFPFHATQQ